jgi:hypothetical protein
MNIKEQLREKSYLVKEKEKSIYSRIIKLSDAEQAIDDIVEQAIDDIVKIIDNAKAKYSIDKWFDKDEVTEILLEIKEQIISTQPTIIA